VQCPVFRAYDSILRLKEWTVEDRKAVVATSLEERVGLRRN
jgi:hypothetical protein